MITPDINSNIANINAMTSKLGQTAGVSFQQLTPLTPTTPTPTTPTPTTPTPSTPNYGVNTYGQKYGPGGVLANNENPSLNPSLPSYMNRISPTDMSNYGAASGIANDLNINDTVRNQEIAAQQSRLDSINKYYDSLVGNEQQAGVGRMARTNAIMASAGLMGSEGSVGQGRANAQTVTDANIAKINNQRSNAINGFYNTIETNLPNYVKSLQTNASNQLSKIANDIQGAWQSLAQTANGMNMSFDKYMDYVNSNPQELQTYNQMKQMSGMSDIQLHQLWNNANAPAGPQTTTINGQNYYAITDSKGNVTGWKPYPTSNTSNKGFSLSQGQNYYDEKGNLIASNPKPETVPKATNLTSTQQTQQAAKDMYSQITSVRGTDGYISPENYKAAKDAWAGAGLLPKDFDAYFSIFANPSRLGDYGLESPTTQNSSSTIPFQ